MDFSLTDEQRMLDDTLRRYLAGRYNIKTRNEATSSAAGYNAGIWAELAGLGVIGALFGEEAGGFGGTGRDIAVVFEALGSALVVEPFLSSLIAGRLLRDRPDLVGSIIAGSTIAAAALFESQGRYDMEDVAARADRRGDAWVLTGGKAVVPQAQAADILLVSARTGQGLSLFIVPRDAEGLSIRSYPMIDGGRGGDVSLNAVTLGANALVGGEGQALPALEEAIAAGIVALCAEAVGIMDVVKTMTLDYLRTRVQFGVPLGKFQALRHRMATVALEIEQARSAVINASTMLDGDRLTRERRVSAAKFTIGRVGCLVAEEAIQLHGGIGMTWELPLSHYAKRLTMIDHQLGDEDHHLERYIAIGRD